MPMMHGCKPEHPTSRSSLKVQLSICFEVKRCRCDDDDASSQASTSNLGASNSTPFTLFGDHANACGIEGGAVEGECCAPHDSHCIIAREKKMWSAHRRSEFLAYSSHECELSDLPDDVLSKILDEAELSTTNFISRSTVEIDWKRWDGHTMLSVQTIDASAPYVSDSIKNELSATVVARCPSASPYKFSGSYGRQAHVTFPSALNLTTEEFFELATEATYAFVGRGKYIFLSADAGAFNHYYVRTFTICKKDLSGIHTVRRSLLPDALPACATYH